VISVQGTWAFFTVDGGEPLETPYQTTLPPGTYRIRVFREGFREVVFDARILPEETFERVISLVPEGDG